MAIDIFITDTETKRKVQLPSLPEKVVLTLQKKYATYSILDLGGISLPSGRELSGVSWDGVFYGESRKNFPFIRNWMSPKEIQTILTEWRDNGHVLKLIITDTPINIDVTLSTFEGIYGGGFGDYEYSISFLEYREPEVTVGKNTSLAQTTKRPASNTNSRTYTVKSGDCLWKIAQKYYGNGSKWTNIYNANKSTIESAAKKHGKKSSDNGHWIYPGTVLTIP